MSAAKNVGRRSTLRRVAATALGLAACGLERMAHATPDDNAREDELIHRLAGIVPPISLRVKLDMPAVFSNGYSVPMTIDVENPMTQSDHVRAIHVLAPGNPITTVARFAFTPLSGRAEISTRVRLAKTQNVLAVVELSDGTWLMARQHVAVQTDGCS